ncbi:MAG TPA: sensor histidine kinase [Methylomirabilota bacterium]|nr:sensor histidine kinase [Methylomirabilota bacterium]
MTQSAASGERPADRTPTGSWVRPDLEVEGKRYSLNLRRMWQLTALLMILVSVAPLVVLTAIDYRITEKSAESEILLNTSRVVSNTKLAVEFSLVERIAALDFIVLDNSFDELNDCSRVAEILERLQASFTGFVDLGVIDSEGHQFCYAGPYDLAGVNYSAAEWFADVQKVDTYISDVFAGFRHVPHMVIAVRHDLPDGSFFVLRTSVEIALLHKLLANLEISGDGDAFVINRQGVLQTSSRFHGDVLEPLGLEVPAYSTATRVYETSDQGGQPLVVGYAYIANTPFILMIVNQKEALMEAWSDTRRQVIGLLVVSLSIIVVVTLGVTTYLVGKIRWADRQRVAALHQTEYTSKMASLGRLGAGVAHEINNPLAIIKEKAGLMKDLFHFGDRYADDPKLMGIADSILGSVDRCSAITRRLLNFARDTDTTPVPVDLAETVTEVLGFMGKEAEYRSIDVVVEIEDDVPEITTNRGRLQQILLNVINNAFAAVQDGGRIEIAVDRRDAERVGIRVTDNGCGMTEAQRRRIFEPFFTTKSHHGGVGLGLSITYSLVSELGGSIAVESEVGRGTTFHIDLPVEPGPKGGASR